MKRAHLNTELAQESYPMLADVVLKFSLITRIIKNEIKQDSQVQGKIFRATESMIYSEIITQHC